MKELSIAENNGYIISPLVVKPVNRHDSILLPESLDYLADIADLLDLDLTNSHLTLDTGFWSIHNINLIEELGTIPVIRPNRGRIKDEKKLEKLFENFKENIYKERYRIERSFAWQDKYRKLVIRYETLECTHNGFKYLAYTMVNLKEFIGNLI